MVKCQKCDKQAAFHITDLTDDTVSSVHLCPSCAKEYLQPDQQEETENSATLLSLLSEQFKVGQTADQLAELDQKACPTCGITFFEFRKVGRLGCPNDYTYFAAELEPLIVNIHGETTHKGKVPKRSPKDSETQNRLITLRRQMNEAALNEDYERASQIRDELRRLEQGDPQ